MGYVNAFDKHAADAAEARAVQDAELREARADQAAATEHARTSLYGTHSTHRAHLNNVVHADLTNRGITNAGEIAAAQNAAWKELGGPVMAACPDLPLDTFQALFAQRGGSTRLTDAEILARHESLVSLAGKQARSDMASLETVLKGIPELKRAMEVMGTGNSPFVGLKLLRDFRQHVVSQKADPASPRPWLRGARAAASVGSGSMLNPQELQGKRRS